jgi:DNA topoisomerase-1
MATFGKPATKQTTKVTINVNGTRFFLLGRRTVKEGWIRFYRPHITTEHRPLPEVSEGERLMIASVSCEASLTRPPPRYNPSSFLKRMESEGIGTKGTRAEIIQTLYDRKLAQNQQMQVTGIGRAVLEVLQEYAPSITSVELTRNLEEKVELIKAGKEDSDAVLEEAVTKLRNTIREMKKSEVEIGSVLAKALERSKSEERILGRCPKCKTGDLVILRSSKSGKRFVGCTGYFDGKCKVSFPLPQRGRAKPSKSACSICGYPSVLILTPRRRAWRLCLNPVCPSKRGKRRTEMQNLQQAQS